MTIGMLLMFLSWIAAFLTGSWWVLLAVFFAYGSGYEIARSGEAEDDT